MTQVARSGSTFTITLEHVWDFNDTMGAMFSELWEQKHVQTYVFVSPIAMQAFDKSDYSGLEAADEEITSWYNNNVYGKYWYTYPQLPGRN